MMNFETLSWGVSTLVIAVLLGCPGEDDPTADGIFCEMDSALPDDSDVPAGSITYQPDENDRIEPRDAEIVIRSDESIRATEIRTFGSGDGYINFFLFTAVDDEGEALDGSVGQLIDAGDFPICVKLEARSNENGSAEVSPIVTTYATSDGATGYLSILGQDGDDYVGRFQFDAENTSGDSGLSVTRGAFRAPVR